MNYLNDCINKLFELGYEVKPPLPPPEYETISIGGVSCPQCSNPHVLHWMNRHGIAGVDLRPEYYQIGFVCSNHNCEFKWRVTSRNSLTF